MTTTIDGIDGLKALVGQALGFSAWHEITQAQINTFADATGYLALALGRMRLAEIYDVTGVTMAINYGLNKARFPSPVPVGSKVRAAATLQDIDDVSGGVQVTMAVTFEIE